MRRTDAAAGAAHSLDVKAQLHRTRDLQHSRIEADLDAGMGALFKQCPTLCGFSVRGAESMAREDLALAGYSELFVTEVSVFPQIGLEAPAEISREIAKLLVRLIDDCPETSDLLRERTFARAFH
jgi:hypothetical protein